MVARACSASATLLNAATCTTSRSLSAITSPLPGQPRVDEPGAEPPPANCSSNRPAASIALVLCTTTSRFPGRVGDLAFAHVREEPSTRSTKHSERLLSLEQHVRAGDQLRLPEYGHLVT